MNKTKRSFSPRSTQSPQVRAATTAPSAAPAPELPKRDLIALTDIRYLLEREFGEFLKSVEGDDVDLDISQAEGLERNIVLYETTMKRAFALMDEFRSAPAIDDVTRLSKEIIALTESASIARIALTQAWLRTTYKLIQRDRDFIY